MATTRDAPVITEMTSATTAVAPVRAARWRAVRWYRAAVLVLVAASLAGCVTRISDGGEVIASKDDRRFEVRAARAALAEPVPALVAEVARVVEATQRVWITPGDAHERARLAVALDLEPLAAAADALEAVVVVGAGPDVVASRRAVERMVEVARALARDVTAEMAELAVLADADVELAELVESWAEPGSYSRQVRMFDETGDAAGALAVGLRTQEPGVVPCTAVWARRVAAATLLEERTRELGLLVRNRDGEAFDAARGAFSDDPYGLGMTLGDADAAAAEACWADDSQVVRAQEDMAGLVQELTSALDPQELRS